MADEKTPTPAMLVEFPMALPDTVADFGLYESFDLAVLHTPEAVVEEMNRVHRSMTTSLLAVLQQRAEHGGPLTHDLYLARQQELLAEREARAERAREAAAAIFEESRP